jgi:3-methyladenine DNA glycosylase AlkD
MDSHVKKIVRALEQEIQELSLKNTPNLRAIRKKYSKKIKEKNPQFILDMARELFKNKSYRWLAFELIREHEETITKIGEKELEEFGQDIDSWGAVDAFAGLLAGPAWRNGQIGDHMIYDWAQSIDRWWRRTALVCTVVLNKRSVGGTGDPQRTLNVCRYLVADKDDMVVKAMSWALRELIPYDPSAVTDFLDEYENILAARVKREVMNKLTTGLKNPKQLK